MDWRRDFLRFEAEPKRGEVIQASFKVTFEEFQRRVATSATTREWAVARLGIGRVRRLHASEGPRGKFSVWMSRLTRRRGVQVPACVWLVKEVDATTAVILAYVLPRKTEHATWIRQFTREAGFLAAPDKREELLFDGRDLVNRLVKTLSGELKQDALEWLRRVNVVPDISR